MASAIDLNSCFERTGWGGGGSPTFDTLAGLLRALLAARFGIDLAKAEILHVPAVPE